MKVTLTYLLLIAAYLGYTQNQEISINWERAYGGTQDEQVNSVIPTYDGGFIFVGHTESHNGDIQSGNYQSLDYWVVKINEEGDIEWEKTYGGTGDDYGFSIMQLQDSSYLVGGHTTSNDGDVKSTNHGGMDIWLIKIDISGNLIWEKTIGGTANDYLDALEIAIDNGYIVAGVTNSSDGDIQSGSIGSGDGWVIKIDTSGNIEWEKTYGGTNKDDLRSLCRISDYGYMLAGSYRYKVGINNYFNVQVMRIDKTGKVEWTKTFGGSNRDYAFQIKSLVNDEYIVGGHTLSHDGDVQDGNNGSYDVWLIKIDGQGRLLWEKTFGGSKEENLLFSMDVDNNNNILVGSSTYSDDYDVQSGNHGDCDFWVLSVNDKGSLNWEKTFGGSAMDYTYCIKSLSESEFMVGGITLSNDGDIKSGNHGEKDIWIVNVSVGSPTNISHLNALDENFTVYPNPADNYIRITSDSRLDSYELRICDLTGKLILEKQLTGESTLNIEHLEPGVYLYQVITSENQITGKIIKQ